MVIRTHLFCVSAYLLQSTVSACTNLAAGRKATKDGSVLISSTFDGVIGNDARLAYIPAKDHPEGSLRPIYAASNFFPRKVIEAGGDFGDDYEKSVYTAGHNYSVPIAHIPQVRHTFAYYETMFGVLNENNVGIVESSCASVFKASAKGQGGEAVLGIEMLTQIAMERATTARQAVQLMGDLAFKWGFCSTPNEAAGESLQVADKDEIWTFHILADPTGTSAIWAAVRVPDEHFSVTANMFTLRDVDVKDEANCLASTNVYTVAQERGWWRPGQKFDFTRFYSPGEYAGKYYAGGRMWRALSIVAPSLGLKHDYDDLKVDRPWPWSVKPDELLEETDFMAMHRDYFQGTEWDVSKTDPLLSGFGHSPERSAPYHVGVHRTIAVGRSYFTNIVQINGNAPRPLAGVLWWASGPPLYTAFVPIPIASAQSFKPFSVYSPTEPTPQSIFWRARKIMAACQARFDHMHPIVLKRQHAVEAEGKAMIANLKTRTGLRSTDVAHAVDKHVAAVASAWDELLHEILWRFSANADNLLAANFGYPKDWMSDSLLTTMNCWICLAAACALCAACLSGYAFGARYPRLRAARVALLTDPGHCE